MKNIWVIGRNYPQLSNDMQGSFELEQAKMLSRSGEKVSYLICALHPYKVIKKRGFQEWEDEGVSVYSYSKLFFPRIYPIYMTKLRNYYWCNFFHYVQKKTEIPDIIHVHYPAMLMIADALEEYYKAGSKIIITEHWTKVLTKSLNNIERNQYKKYFKYINTCICVGNPLAKSIKETVGIEKINIVIVPNVIGKEFKVSYSSHKKFKFIAIGRLVKIKQFDKIIVAFAECFREKNVMLTIVGDGKEYHTLKKIIFDLNINKQVTLTGSLNRMEVAQHIANADCLVCYSKLETFGVPIIEAWVCGVPTIATTAAAVIDKFDNRLGIEVDPRNIKELKNAMLYIYNHTNKYDKEFISKFAKKRFSEDVITRKLLDIYQR